MAHHRDPHTGQSLGELGDPAPALQLDGVHAAFLDESPGAFDRLLGRRVIRHERHIAHQQGLARATRDRLGVMDHLVHRHRQRGRVAQHHHAETVAHQQDRNAGLVEDLSAQEVVGGEHGETAAFVFETLDVQHRGHRRTLLRVAATSGVSALRTRSAAAGSSPALRAISSVIAPSIR